jgi:asparagine synthase (glutamine-hydrolysing)
VPVAVPLGVHLPRPRDRTQALAYEHAHLDVARTIGAEAFVTGNGGDSVFAYSQSAAPVADRYLSEGLHLETFRTLLDVCRQTGCSLFDAAMAAWRIARGPHAYRCRPNPLFLDRSVIAELTGLRFDHPWLNAPADALPGKAAHIAWILRVQQSLEPSRGHQLPVLNPLMSQPIIETCLAVPSWQWRTGGRDRSLARHAFAGDLPRIIVDRRIKGSPGHFAGRILDHFRPAIRQRLLDGKLARQGIIDTRAIEEALKGERPCTDDQRVRILELVAVEAWLDSWASRARPQRGDEHEIRMPADARSHSSAGSSI